MATFQSPGDMVVNTAAVLHKIRIHAQASNQRAVARKPLFHARCCGYCLRRGDFCQPFLPISTFLTGLIAGSVRETCCVNDANFLANSQGSAG